MLWRFGWFEPSWVPIPFTCRSFSFSVVIYACMRESICCMLPNTPSHPLHPQQKKIWILHLLCTIIIIIFFITFATYCYGSLNMCYLFSQLARNWVVLVIVVCYFCQHMLYVLQINLLHLTYLDISEKIIWFIVMVWI